MENLSNLALMLKESQIVKELLRIFLGLFFIFLFNLIFPFSIDKIANFNLLNSTSKVLFLIVVAYFFAHICISFGYFLQRIVVFLFFTKNKGIQVREMIQSYIKEINTEKYTPTEDRVNTRSMFEAIEYFKDSKYLLTSYNEASKNVLISLSFSGFAVFMNVLAFFTHSPLQLKYFFIFSLILIIHSCSESNNLSNQKRRLVNIYQRTGKN